VHKYEVILRDLSNRIAGMEAGAKLPTEKELAAQFGASTMTVRRALQIMIDNGRLRGIPGRGTFIVQPRVTKTMSSASSFTDAMRAAGRLPGSRLLEATIRESSDEEASWFRLPAGSPVYVITRVRLGDDIPLAHETATLNATLFPGLLGANLELSLYDTLESMYGIEVVRTGLVVAARLPGLEEARHLRIDRTVPCLETTVTSTDGSGTTVEHTRSLFRGDMYEVSL
jgi:GntR family transcriptional regulator